MMKFAFFLILLVTQSQAKVEFCLGGRHELYAEQVSIPSLEIDSFFEYDEETPIQKRQPRAESRIEGCAAGILFNRPITLEAVNSDEDPFCYKETLCDEDWKCNIQKRRIVAEILRIGKPSKNESWVYVEGDHDVRYGADFAQCRPSKHGLEMKNAFSSNASPHHGRAKREITGLVPSEPASADLIQREVDDQTKRMFYYLSGINQDQVNSHLRIVKLFKMSTQLVSMVCDPQYISPRFLQEVERGFLFLLKEQGFDKMVDLDLDSYNQLKQTLEHCAATVKMIKFLGSPCPTGIKVEHVYQYDEMGRKIGINYGRNSRTFKWGEYDVVLDAAWSTMTTVYAGCFNSFRGKVNLLHKFEVALEQLFHSALYVRWEHPTQLADDLFYDSVFMARVNDTMEAMDACSRILHLLTPLFTPLNRPIHETLYRRKKRAAEGEPPSASASLENSVDSPQSATKYQRKPGHASTSSQEEDYEDKNLSPAYQCLTTEEERMRTEQLIRETEYNHCKPF